MHALKDVVGYRLTVDSVLPLKFMHGFLHHLQGQVRSGNEQQMKCFSLKDREATDDDFYRLKVMNPDVFSSKNRKIEISFGHCQVS